MNNVPPNDPWQPLSIVEDGGYLSIYYSEDLSRLPIRWVTKPGDNKSDPNFETCTYGLFSTCSPGMRSGVVHRGRPYIFFATNWNGSRALSGFFHVKWFAPAASARARDYYLAADEIHFVRRPIPLKTVDGVCKTSCNRRFRGAILLDSAECARMRNLLLTSPNDVSDYLQEISRLEQLSLTHTGYRYPSWKRVDGFSWADANLHLTAHTPEQKKSVANESDSGMWKCSNCGSELQNKALLRLCPECKAVGTFVALATE